MEFSKVEKAMITKVNQIKSVKVQKYAAINEIIKNIINF